MKIRKMGLVVSRLCLAISLLAGSAAAMAACETFKEYLPVEVGGGCVVFTICCYGSHCEVSDVQDHPGIC